MKKETNAKKVKTETKPKAVKEKKPVAVKNIHEALFAFQGENITLPRNGSGKAANSKVYKYVTLDDLINITRPFLMKYNLMFTQLVHTDKMETQLVHAPSETKLSSDINLGNPNNMQDYGGRITYARRYALTALLGLSAEEDVDAAPIVADTTPEAPKNATVTAPEAPRGMKTEGTVNQPQEAIETATAKVLKSESFMKAKTAIDTAFSEEALDLLKTQIEKSAKLTEADKAELKELANLRETEVVGTIR